MNLLPYKKRVPRSGPLISAVVLVVRIPLKMTPAISEIRRRNNHE